MALQDTDVLAVTRPGVGTFKETGANIRSYVITGLPPGTVVSAAAPTSPLTGQGWYSTTTDVLSIWDGTVWQPAMPDATELAAGVAEIATQTEVDAGTDDQRIVTPAKLAAKLATIPSGSNWSRTGTELSPAIAGDTVAISAGTAALPGLRPVGDPNTGIYSPGADTVAVSTGASERLRISSAGSLLVGTAASAGNQLLQVNSDALINGVTVGRGSNAIVTNTAVGNNALLSNGTGNNSTAVGSSALQANTSGSNTAVGHNALNSNTTGTSNTGNGVSSLFTNTTGDRNTASGLSALFGNTIGSGNTAIGVSALLSNSTANDNTAVGVSCLRSNTTGTTNTAIGVNAGWGGGQNANTQGSNNTFIGYNAVGSGGAANNTITLGNSSIVSLRCQVTTITGLSDERDKADIINLDAGLDFINTLRPVSFTWNTRDGGKVGIKDAGFIAQELLSAQETTGTTIPNLVSQENPDRLEAGYGTLIPVLVNAVQELTAMVKDLQSEIATLKGAN